MSALPLLNKGLLCSGPLFYLLAYLTHFCHLFFPSVWKLRQFRSSQTHSDTHTHTLTKSSFTPWCHRPEWREVCGPSAALSRNSPWVWKHAGAAGSQQGPGFLYLSVLHCLGPLAIKLNGAPAGSQGAVYDPGWVPSTATSLLMEGGSSK